MRKLVMAAAGAALGITFWAGAADAPGGSVLFIDKSKVAAGFAKGGTLLNKGEYQILTSRRVEPGLVEVHALDTDIMYVTEGSATITTGGSVVDGKATAPNEVRGKSISGGQTQKLTKGDVFIVPHNTPHWFSQVDKLCTYYVVKVRTGK